VALQDERNSYECAGHDYVMDIISEKEVAPGFPVYNTEWLASTLSLVSSQCPSSDLYGSFLLYIIQYMYTLLSNVIEVND